MNEGADGGLLRAGGLWLGHNRAWFYVGEAGAAIGAAVVAFTSPSTLPALVWPAVATVVLVWTMDAFATAYHRAALCPMCVAVVPLDLYGALRRYRRELTFYHQGFWAVVPYALPLLVVLAIPAGFARTHLAAVVAVMSGAMAAALGISAVEARATRIHNALMPWCPRCRRNDGGRPTRRPPNPPGRS